jgi:hypothetical protein
MEVKIDYFMQDFARTFIFMRGSLFPTNVFIYMIVCPYFNGQSDNVYFLSSFRQFICPSDQESLREDEPHRLGEGLALGYHCGFLKFLLHKNNTLACKFKNVNEFQMVNQSFIK